MNIDIISFIPHLKELIDAELFESVKNITSILLSEKVNKNSKDLKYILMYYYGESLYGLEEYQRACVLF